MYLTLTITLTLLKPIVTPKWQKLTSLRRSAQHVNSTSVRLHNLRQPACALAYGQAVV